MKHLKGVVALLLFVCWASFGDAANNFISNALGSNMVLQRSPSKARIWGWTKQRHADVTLSVMADDHSYSKNYTKRSSSQDGSWTIELDPRDAGGPYTILASSTSGDNTVLKNVMFGDVWICGGQSNMEFTLDSVFNHTSEVQDASHFPFIRLYTVGQSTISLTPLDEFAQIEQNWSIGSPTSVGNGNWTYFSAVCWLFGKELAEKMPGIPIGLVSSNWGGTYVQAWSSPDALKKCNSDSTIMSIPQEVEKQTQLGHFDSKAPKPNQPSVLWNAMIVPLLTMRVKGAIWYQGEANVGHASYYSCAFPAMITDWRAKFGLSAAEFGFYFVQLAAYTQGNPGNALAEQRIAQAAALQLQYVGMATAIDLGDLESPFGNIHPRNKQTVSKRLALAAEAITYGQSVSYLGPLFVSMSVVHGSPNAVVSLKFSKASVGGGLVLVDNTCPSAVGVANCAWLEVQSSDGNWHNATSITIQSDNSIQASVKLGSLLNPTGVRYGFAEWPVAILYNKHGLPATPFVYTSSSSSSSPKIQVI